LLDRWQAVIGRQAPKFFAACSGSRSVSDLNASDGGMTIPSQVWYFETIDQQPSFREIQAARDASMLLLGLGWIALVFSFAWLLLSDGTTAVGSFGWFLGPVILLVACICLTLGHRYKMKALELRSKQGR